jgi:hypothetical protein
MQWIFVRVLFFMPEQICTTASEQIEIVNSLERKSDRKKARSNFKEHCRFGEHDSRSAGQEIPFSM